MGYLLGALKLGEAGVDAYKGVRDIVERSRFKSFAEDNPDWAENPDKIEKAISLSPELAYAGADRGRALYDQRQQRASARLQFQMQGEEGAHRAYSQALQPVGGEAAETGDADMGYTPAPGGAGGAPGSAGGGDNFAGADKAGNDYWQRWLQTAEDQFGPEFANRIRQSNPVWSIDGYAKRQPVYDSVLNGFREVRQISVLDPKTNTRSVISVPMTPIEQSRWLRDNQELKPIALKQGESIPEAYSQPSGPLGPQVSTRGEVKAGPLAEQSAREREFYGKLPEVTRFQASEPVYLRGKQTVRLGTKVGDQQASIALALLDNPGAVASEGGVQYIANPGLLSQQTQMYLNWLDNQKGVFTAEQRKEIDKAFDVTYGDIREQFMRRRAEAGEREKSLKLPEGSLTSVLTHTPEERLAQIRGTPFANGAPAGNAGETPGAAVVPKMAPRGTPPGVRPPGVKPGEVYMGADGKLHVAKAANAGGR